MDFKCLLTTLTHQSSNQQAFTKRQQQKLEEYGSIQLTLNYGHSFTKVTEMKWSDTLPTQVSTSERKSTWLDHQLFYKLRKIKGMILQFFINFIGKWKLSQWELQIHIFPHLSQSFYELNEFYLCQFINV